ncbi:hypothetical protein ENUP19_0082G0065 [Entamoeba nuttalli]
MIKLFKMKPSKSTKGNENKPAYFKDVRNYKVYEQSIFLALLNQYFDITLRLPIKQAKVFEQILVIDSISREEDYVDVVCFIDKRCSERYNFDLTHGVSKKTCQRRFETNKLTESLHFLSDVIAEFGYVLERRNTKGKKGTLKCDLIDKIFLNDKLLFNKDDIIKKGKLINQYLCELFVSSRITVKKNDLFLSSFV